MNKFIVTLRWPPPGIGRQYNNYNVENLRPKQQQQQQQQQQSLHHHHHHDHKHHHDLRKHEKVTSVERPAPISLCGVMLWTTIISAIGIVIFLLCIEIDHSVFEYRTLGPNNNLAEEQQIISGRYVDWHKAGTPNSADSVCDGACSTVPSPNNNNNHTFTLQTISGTLPEVHHQWPVLEPFSSSFSANAISGVSLTIAIVSNLFSAYYSSTRAVQSRIFSGPGEKCSVLPLRFSLGILILLLVQMPPAVHSLASVTGIKLRSEIAAHSRRRITDNTTYNAILDGEILLPCNITAPSLDDSATLVLWYRDDIASPIYTVDARTTATLDMGRHFPETDIFGARASFNLSYPLSYLRIRPVKAADSGDYRCRVDFRRARTVNRILKLTVIVPTTEVKIYDPKRREILGSTAGPFDEGTNVILICDSDKGIPLPAVHWWRGAQQLSSDYIVVNNTISRNIVTLTNVSRDDLLTTLTCRADNTNLTVPVTKSVTLDLNLKPREIRIITPAANITAGESQTIELACQSSGSKPPAKIYWFRDDEPLSAITESISSDGATTTSFLSFVPSIEYNGKVIVCRAENTAMSPDTPGVTVEDKWPVNIYYPPMLALIMGSDSRSGDIVEGANVYFECDVKSNPPVSSIEWRLNGNLLEASSTNQLPRDSDSDGVGKQDHSGQNRTLLEAAVELTAEIMESSTLPTAISSETAAAKARIQTTARTSNDIEIRNGTLRISNVSHRHFGHYQCYASNSLATSHSETVFLNVKYAPRCSNQNWTLSESPSPTGPPILGVAIGEQITIDCEVSANPEEMIFEWSFNHSIPINERALKFTSTGLRSTAKFSPLEDGDFGTLFCNARNTIGKQQTPCAYRLVKAEPPSSPNNCTIVNKTSNSLTLECLPGHSGGLEQHFHLQAYTLNPNKLLKTLQTENWPRFTLQELPSGYIFKLVIFASNRRGRSGAIEITGSTTEPSPWKSAEYGVVDGPALSVSPILIVSLLALLLLCTIVVLFVKIRIKLKHRSNEKVHATANSLGNAITNNNLQQNNCLNNKLKNTTATPLKSIMKKKTSQDNLLELASFVELHSDPSLLSSAAIEFCTDTHLMENYGQSDNDASQPSSATTATTGNLCTVNVLTLPYYVPSLADYGTVLSSGQSNGLVSSSSTPLTVSSGCTLNSGSVTVSGVESQLQTFLSGSQSLITNHHSQSLPQQHHHHFQHSHHSTIGEHPTELPILNIVNATPTVGIVTSGSNVIPEQFQL